VYKAATASCKVVVVKPMSIVSSVSKGRIPALAIAVFVVAAVAMLLLSGSASAEGFKFVQGVIEDSAGNPLEGATVVIEVRDPLNAPSGPTRYTDSVTSDEDGFYFFILSGFGPVEWQIGDTIKIIATWSGNQKDESAIADDSGSQTIDVTFPFEIPQFGSILGFGIAAGGIGLIAMVFVVKRKKD
jgi:hypothetical protein